MDLRIQGWVMENPPVKAALDRLHAEHPRMQVAFLGEEVQRLAAAEGIPVTDADATTLVVKPDPDTDAQWAVDPQGNVMTLREGA